jgi:hypothetical protein
VSLFDHRSGAVWPEIAGLLPGRHLLQQSFSLNEFGPGGFGLICREGSNPQAQLYFEFMLALKIVLLNSLLIVPVDLKGFPTVDLKQEPAKVSERIDHFR